MVAVKGMRRKRKSGNTARQQKGGGGAPNMRNVALMPRRFRAVLDKAALDYRTLLLDPCSGPLVHGLYASGGAGITFRSESIFSVNTGGTSTAGFVHYCPGAYGTGSSGCTYFGEAASDALPVATIGPVGFVPGITFLAANAASVRPVATCMQIMYTGSEASRAGIIYLGQTPGSYVTSGSTPTVNSVLGSLQFAERMPVNGKEVIWRPGNADDEFVDVNGPSSSEGKNAITFAYAGAPAGVQIRVRIVTVWEFKFAKNLGLVDDPGSVNLSSNTQNDVMRTLQDMGSAWVRDVGSTAARVIGSELRRQAGDYVRAISYGYQREGTTFLTG